MKKKGNSGMKKLPLLGIRILDFGHAWAAPVAGYLLADMGAEVIKVETAKRIDGIRMGRPIIGDDIAGGDEGKWPNLQPAFHAVNRNKLGITLDIKHPRGVALMKRLVKISDVVLDNFSPGVLDRAGLGHKSLEAIKPDIITISMTGVGEYGPLKDVVTYAAATMALGGLSSLIGYEGQGVLGMTAIPFGDGNASIHAVVAILAAIYYANRTGEGQHIDLSETETVIGILGEAVLEYGMNGLVPGPQGNTHPTMSPHGNYPCREEGWVSIAVKTQEEWKKFCRVLGKLAWTKEERFADGYGRLQHRHELDELISKLTANYTSYEITDMLQEVGVAAFPVMNIHDQYVDPHFRARGIIAEFEHPLVGIELLQGVGWKLSETPGAIYRPAPSLGEHNTYVFHDLLGLSIEEIKQLTDEEILH